MPPFTEFLNSVHSENDWKSVVDRTADFMLDLGSGRGLKENDLKSIVLPTLICLGSKDNMVSPNESTNSARVLANGAFQLIDGFYHPFEKNNINILANIIVSHAE